MSAELRPHGVRDERASSASGRLGSNSLKAGLRSPDRDSTMSSTTRASNSFFRVLHASGGLLDLSPTPIPPLVAGHVFFDAWLGAGRALRSAVIYECQAGRAPVDIKLGIFEGAVRDALTEIVANSVVMSAGKLLGRLGSEELQGRLRSPIESGNAGPNEQEGAASHSGNDSTVWF